mmetsp:Transcript_62172/g.200435  ORF Transcript_62172/g.200435 Transcript_62172/m.200435 type:complete len:201 (-) Transcript_62172:592-1194(-)
MRRESRPHSERAIPSLVREMRRASCPVLAAPGPARTVEAGRRSSWAEGRPASNAAPLRAACPPHSSSASAMQPRVSAPAQTAGLPPRLLLPAPTLPRGPGPLRHGSRTSPKPGCNPLACGRLCNPRSGPPYIVCSSRAAGPPSRPPTLRRPRGAPTGSRSVWGCGCPGASASCGTSHRPAADTSPGKAPDAIHQGRPARL